MTRQALLIALGGIEKSAQAVTAARYVGSRRPLELDGVERVLLELLADVEDALAVVRRMQTRAAA